MEKYSVRTIDEAGRIALHSDIRKKLNLNTGDEVSLTLVGTILILQRKADASESANAVCQVNNVGMIDLPTELRQKLNWKVLDKVSMYLTDDMVIIKSA